MRVRTEAAWVSSSRCSALVVSRRGGRIVGELEAARARGDEQLMVGYSQSEIGIRGNATQMAVFIRRKIEKAGF